LKVYDYVKEFGEGVDRMCKELASEGIKDNETLVNNILVAIRENPNASYTTLAEMIGTSYKTVRTIMSELVEAHVLTRVGPKRGGFWKII
jgi:ATP-dependent DNA helicase RecG